MSRAQHPPAMRWKHTASIMLPAKHPRAHETKYVALHFQRMTLEELHQDIVAEFGENVGIGECRITDLWAEANMPKMTG